MAQSVCLKISMFLVVIFAVAAAAQETGLSPSPSPTPGMDKGAAISVQMASIALTGASLIFSLFLPLLNH
nr:transmembrane protein, putative [Ipomoea batatas]GMC88701.1 transmembrane protein, putative [Ipomoea batatas]